jgi:type IX secretion system PorP/SprF family membrane protein
MKKVLICYIFIVLSITLNAQQIFRISQIQQHSFLYNPAASGAAIQASVGAAYRKMWSGIEGGPQTSLAFFDKYFNSKKIGTSLVLYSDKTGPTSRTGGQLNVSYSIPLENNKRLMFGLGADVLQYRINKARFANYIPNDPLLASSGTKTKADAAVGVYYNSNTWNVGISAQQILQQKLNFISTTSNPEGKLYRHYFLTVSNNISIDEANVIIPNLVFKYLPNAPTDFEAGFRFEHNNLFWFGFNTHYKQSFTALAGLYINKNIAVGYAFDNYKTPLSIFDNGGGGHELTIKYLLKK